MKTSNDHSAMTEAEIDSTIQSLERKREKLVRMLAIQMDVHHLERQFKTHENYGQIVNLIALEVCQQFDIQPSRILMRSRFRVVCEPRQAVFFICREIHSIPLSHIQKVFGITHGTIICGCKTTRDKMETDPAYKAKVDAAIEAIAISIRNQQQETRNDKSSSTNSTGRDAQDSHPEIRHGSIHRDDLRLEDVRDSEKRPELQGRRSSSPNGNGLHRGANGKRVPAALHRA